MPTSKILAAPLVFVASVAVWAQQPAISAAPIKPANAPSSYIARPVVKPGVPPVPAPPAVLMRRVAEVQIPGRPGFDGVALYDGNLIMAHPAASTVDVFSVPKRRVIAEIKNMNGADGIAVDAKAGKAYVANSDAKEIAVVSLKDWSVERRIPLHASPSTLLIIPKLNLLLASNWRDLSVSEIDLMNNGVAKTVDLDGRPSYMAFDPGSQQIYVSLEDQNAVAVLDPSLKLVKRIPLVASQPTGLAIDPQSRRLFVSVRHAVVAIDLNSDSEINRVAAPVGVDQLWFEPAHNRLYAAANGSVLVMSTKGRLTVDKEWPTQVKGHTIAFDPHQDMLYLPGGHDGQSKLLLLRSLDRTAQNAVAEGYLPGETVATK